MEQFCSTVLPYQRSPKPEAVVRVASGGMFPVFPFGDLAMPMLPKNYEPASKYASTFCCLKIKRL